MLDTNLQEHFLKIRYSWALSGLCISILLSLINYILGVPTVTVLKSDYTVTAASPVTLNCIVSSSTNISNVFWKRTIDNDVTLIQTNKFKFSGSTPSFPSLTINNAGLRDAGQYQCFAENEAGTGQSVFTTLTVDSKYYEYKPVSEMTTTYFNIISNKLEYWK